MRRSLMCDATAALLGLLLGLRAAPALGDAPWATPKSYKTTAQGGSVVVCVSADSSDEMTRRELLRQNLSTGQVMAVASASRMPASPVVCPPSVGSQSCHCMKDECVPPGSYRYGWSPTLSGCTQLFGEIVVSNSPPADCVSAAPSVPPASSLPWNSSTSNPGHCWVEEGGCAVAGPGPAVLGIQALVFVLGVLLARRRRGR